MSGGGRVADQYCNFSLCVIYIPIIGLVYGAERGAEDA